MSSSTSYQPERGDIVWLDMNPRTGHEQSGRRPAIVLSPKLFYTRTSLTVVCPITNRVKGLPYEILLERTKTKGAILPIHIRSVDAAARRIKFIEKAPRPIVARLTQAVQAILGQ